MSLRKDSCKECWLPPLPNSQVCRKHLPPVYNEMKWVLYHRPSVHCRLFRSIIINDEYTGSVVPENCIQCCNLLTTREKWAPLMVSHIKQKTYIKLSHLFSNASEKKDALLDYVCNLLALVSDDVDTCKKIMSAILHVFKGKEKWLVEELVQRPTAYHLLLHQPLIIPEYLNEDIYGFFDSLESWWAFWEKMPEATRRRIQFRCLTFKEELLAVAWHPNRVMKWCFDSDTEFLN